MSDKVVRSEAPSGMPVSRDIIAVSGIPQANLARQTGDPADTVWTQSPGMDPYVTARRTTTDYGFKVLAPCDLMIQTHGTFQVPEGSATGEIGARTSTSQEEHVQGPFAAGVLGPGTVTVESTVVQRLTAGDVIDPQVISTVPGATLTNWGCNVQALAPATDRVVPGFTYKANFRGRTGLWPGDRSQVWTNPVDNVYVQTVQVQGTLDAYYSRSLGDLYDWDAISQVKPPGPFTLGLEINGVIEQVWSLERTTYLPPTAFSHIFNVGRTFNMNDTITVRMMGVSGVWSEWWWDTILTVSAMETPFPNPDNVFDNVATFHGYYNAFEYTGWTLPDMTLDTPIRAGGGIGPVEKYLLLGDVVGPLFFPVDMWIFSIRLQMADDYFCTAAIQVTTPDASHLLRYTPANVGVDGEWQASVLEPTAIFLPAGYPIFFEAVEVTHVRPNGHDPWMYLLVELAEHCPVAPVAPGHDWRTHGYSLSYVFHQPDPNPATPGG